MKITSKKRNALLVVIIFLMAIMVAVLLLTGTGPAVKKEKIGFIITGSIDEGGWNGMHYNGASNACEMLGVQLLVKENIKEYCGECGSAVEELVGKGCKMIILTSFGYVEEVKDIISKYPDVAFYSSSFGYHADNVTSFFSRMYQARYLAGIVAGMKTQTGRIGYVAAMPTSEVNRGIDAFTLGVRRVNPEATVTVAWSGEWDDEEQERKQADALIENVGVDVLTYHQNKTYVAQEAEKYGIYSIGYHQSLEGHSDKFLTAVVCDWEQTYEAIIRQYLRGNSHDIKIYWVGMEEKTVKLDGFSPIVGEEIREEVSRAQNEILAGHDVFSGVIYDNKGNIRCKENQTIRDEILLENLDWYVKGVEFYE